MLVIPRIMSFPLGFFMSEKEFIDYVSLLAVFVDFIIKVRRDQYLVKAAEKKNLLTLFVY